MRVLRAGGRRYSDPDVIALLREHREATDPYEVVTVKARTLLTDFGAFEAGNLSPFDRMRALASFAGFAVRPMTGTESARAERDAVLMPTTDSAKRGIILYNPSRPVARTIHSIGHEIVHSFFPSSRYGAQFRSLAAVDSRPGRELELLCDHGAAELTMPHDAFASRAAGFDLSLNSVDAIREPFGTSFEATVYRLAQLAPMPAATALFRWPIIPPLVVISGELGIAVEQIPFTAFGSVRSRSSPGLRQRSRACRRWALRVGLYRHRRSDPSSVSTGVCTR
jgi:hypothetical protein